jgi:carboxypeptidase family protein
MQRAMLWASLTALLAAGACRTVAPVVGGGDVPGARGTISGTVRGADNTAPAVGRKVEAVEVDTGARYDATTNVTGGFTIMVPKGRYRLSVALLEGESVEKDPGVISIGTSDADSRIDIVLSGGSRPESPGR